LIRNKGADDTRSRRRSVAHVLPVNNPNVYSSF
jgi:hypothetical protein